MTFKIPTWYRLLGSVAATAFRLARSPRTRNWPSFPEGCVWIHAASLGELKGSLRLADSLPTQTPVVLTSTTSSGLDKLRCEAPQIPSCLLPLDQAKILEAFLQTVSPKCAVFLEAEAWPCVLQELSARNLPVAMVAFRASERSLARWQTFSRVFPGWTDGVQAVWTQNQSQTHSVKGLGFRQVRPGSLLKWAGFPKLSSPSNPNRMAAISIHLKDFRALARLRDRFPNRGWLWYPRRNLLAPVLRVWARVLGLRPVDHPSPHPNEVWIAPRFGLVASTLPGCLSAWVSPGHDLEEPLYLGVEKVYTDSNILAVHDSSQEAGQTLAEIIEWIRGQMGTDR